MDNNSYLKTLLGFTLAPVFALAIFFPFISRGPDFAEYLNHFYTSKACLTCLFDYQGLGFTVLMGTLSRLGLSFNVFLYIVVCGVLAIKLAVSSKLIDRGWLISIAFYITSYLFLHEFIQVRLAAAISLIFLAGYTYFFANHKLIGLLTLLLSIAFHPSVLLVLLAFFTFKLTQKYFLFSVSILGVLLFLSFNKLLFSEVILKIFEIVSEMNFGSINLYTYELATSDYVNVNNFSVQTLDVIFVLLLYHLLRYENLHTSKYIKFYDFIAHMAILGVLLKFVTVAAPAVSFRVFELLTVGVFLLKATIVLDISQFSLRAAYIIFCIFILTNIYVYIYSSPLLN
jgi:hypothetical protein